MAIEVSLEEATVEQLIDELGARFRTVVIGTEREPEGVKGNNPETASMMYDFRGGIVAASGLARWVDRNIEWDMMNEEYDGPCEG